MQQWSIDKFIVTGLSKRGWTAWLAAMTDPEIIAVVPFVTDLLNTQHGLEHMYFSYGKNWPVAFYPYYQQHIDEKIKTPNFIKLMKIADPLQYMNNDDQTRLSIVKYIINSSGDDFYVPDNSRFYYKQLVGEKSLRVVPNTDHAGIRKFTQQSLTAFLNRFQNNNKLPQLVEHVDKNILTVTFSEQPVEIIRWTATNTLARDFRYACNINYAPTTVVADSTDSIRLLLNDNMSGWEATFVEATFKDGYVATTQVYITSDDKYPHQAPPKGSAACQTLPGLQ